MFKYDELQLNRPLRATSDAAPEDVLSAKSAFKQLGYYETPSYGLTPYPYRQLFDGVREFQKDNGLTVDGYMLPAGETEQSMNESLAFGKTDWKNDEERGCAEPAIQPWQIPSWGSRRPRDYCALPREREKEDERERRCTEQWESDNDRCRALPRPAAQARCWASANERRVLCERRRNGEALPDLDTGEW